MRPVSYTHLDVYKRQGCGKADIAIARLTREGDDGDAGMALFEGGDDMGCGFDSEIGEIRALQAGSP